MGVTCQILINKPTKGVHKAGKPISGVVKYTVDKPGRYKDITLSLIGEGKCSWQERQKNKHNNKNKTVTYVGREIYTNQRIILHDKGPEGIFILPIGVYERPFSFILPNNIPSSSEDTTCKIKYRLILKFERPDFLSIHKKYATEINVLGNVHAVTPEGKVETKLEKSLFKPFSRRKHRIQLQAEIPNTIFKPGENVQINYNITNDSDVIVPSLKAELVCHKTYTADCGRRKEQTKTINECTVETTSIPDNAIANLTSNMTLSPFSYTIQHSRIIRSEYSIKITLRLPMPHMNSSMKFPVVIGEKYGADDVELYVPDAGDFEEPPPYFQVMNELEDNNNDKDFETDCYSIIIVIGESDNY